mgnify:CR=1 FL=1|tara:strand:- start:316 stop:690 length:375 start_codon:yes stop_codon:yes gene_type:complete
MWGHIPIVNHKFIYARSVSNLVDDDDHIASVLFPLSAFRGFLFLTSTAIIMRFESPYQYVTTDNFDCDALILTITSGQHKDFMTEFVREITFGDSAVIVMRDDVTDEGFDGVTSVGINSDVTAD